LDLIHSFSTRGQNVDFWLLSKNNTGRLPLRGNPAGNKQNTDSQTQSLNATLTCSETLKRFNEALQRVIEALRNLNALLVFVNLQPRLSSIFTSDPPKNNT